MNVSRLDDFLALSLAHPNGLPAFNEPLANGGHIEVWDTGVLCIEPAYATDKMSGADNKDIVLSCGIHGNETAPIEMCQRLLSYIISGQVQCQHRVLLIFGNLDAINLAIRQVEDNLNRLFCGEHGLTEQAGCRDSRASPPNKEQVRAAKLEQYLTRFYHQRAGAERWHLDLHTAIRASHYEQFAVYPYTPDARYSRTLLAFLDAAKIQTVLLSDAPSPTFSYFSAVRFGALSLTVELGKVRPFGENDPQQLAQLEQCLSRLLSTPSVPAQAEAAQLEVANLRVFQVCQEITKKSTQFCFHFDDDVVNFQHFEPGYVLAEDGSQQWQVGEQAEAVIFPNAQVAIGHRAALMVKRAQITAEMLKK